MVRHATGHEDIPDEVKQHVFQDDEFLKSKLKKLRTVLTDTFVSKTLLSVNFTINMAPKKIFLVIFFLYTTFENSLQNVIKISDSMAI